MAVNWQFCRKVVNTATQLLTVMEPSRCNADHAVAGHRAAEQAAVGEFFEAGDADNEEALEELETQD